MKSTASMIAVAPVWVIASGCLAAPAEDLEQEAIELESAGAVQQATSLPAAATKHVTCGTRDFIESQIGGDREAATTIFRLCKTNGTNQVAVAISGKTHQFYDASSGNLAFERGLWYAAAKTGKAADKWWDSRQSCFAPYAHFTFRTTGFDTWTDCPRGSQAVKYHEFDSTERADECNRIMNSTLKTMSESNGISIESLCSNIVAFDPLGTAGTGCGWLC
jgi:hypothetical protein